MHLIEVIWLMCAAASATLAAIHALVWLHRRSEHADLAFAFTAVSACAIAMVELAMMRAESVERYADLVRWIHLPIAVLVVALVVFVRLFMNAGRLWLMWTVIGARLLVLAINLASQVSINFSAITDLRRVPVFGGDSVTAAQSVANPLTLIAELTNLALLAYVLDASWTVWRRGERRMAAVLGGSFALFTILAAGHSTLVIRGYMDPPFIIGLSFICIVMAMAYELSRDALRSNDQSRDLRRSQLELHDRDRQIDLAVRSANLGLWSVDVGRDEVWMTDQARALYGVGPTEPITRDRILRAVHPDDRTAVERAVEAAVHDGGEFVSEHRIVVEGRPDRWVTVRGAVEFDTMGRPVWIRAVSFDVTERYQAAERFRTLVEASPIAIVMVDSEGRIALVNAQTEAIFGYERSQMIGMSVESLIPQRFRDRHVGHRLRYAADMRARSMGTGMDLRGLHRDGTEFPIVVGLSPVQMPEGVYVLATIADISERKRAEAELQRQRDELVHLSRVTMLGELSGAMAHELNQPLTAILSNAQAAQRFLNRADPNLDEVREILGDIVEQDKRAGEVIRRLRLLLKKGQTQRESIDLTAMISEVLNLMHSDLIEHGVQVVTRFAPRLEHVLADRIQLQQVLLNLVMNGCQAMEQTAATERLLTIDVAAEAGGVRLSVADRGCGIPADQLERIFEPFVTTKPQGMGLGLAVCATIVSAHGGRLWATNNPDGGATVHLILPTEVGDGA